MSTEKPQVGRGAGAGPGALLLCRAAADSVAPAAHLLRERMLLTGADDDWSVLVPEGKPWLYGDEPVDRVLTGWAAALAVGAPWPVLALWWDGDRAGYTLASGFRRPVGYVWLADGTPAGEDEAMRTFAARLGLDPVLDLRSLDHLTKPDPEADARTRLRARQIERSGRREVVRTELEAVESSRLGPCLPWSGTPAARALSLAQLTAGLPLAALGLRRRSAGWIVAGALLLAHGALGTAYEPARPRD
jgi:hypothetical protein